MSNHLHKSSRKEYLQNKHLYQNLNKSIMSTENTNVPSQEQWKQYKRKGLSEMRPYITGEDITNISISQPDTENGSPKEGDMIARNPKNHSDKWLVAKKYFEDNLEEA
jgi:hypothetical protein